MGILVSIEKSNIDLSTRAQARQCYQYAKKHNLDVEQIYRETLAVLLELHSINEHSKSIKMGLEKRHLHSTGVAV